MRQQRSVVAVARARSCTTASRSTCSTPPATPTSSATCAPACAPPTPRCSSSPPPTASTARPGCCGRSAPRSACRARSWSPSSTRRAPTSTRPSPLPAASSATACCRSTCRCTPTTARAAGLIGLLSQHGLRLLRAAPASSATPTPSTCRSIEGARDALIEGIIAESEDETLMDRYLGGEDIDVEVAHRRPRDGGRARLASTPCSPSRAPDRARHRPSCSRCSPRLPVAARAPAAGRSPRPTARPREPLTCDPDGPLVAEVVKTTTDPYVGRISLVRVFSGTLRPDVDRARLRARRAPTRGHEDHDVDERVGALSSPLGKTQRTGRSRASPATSSPSPSSPRAETGDTLSAKDDPLLDRAVGHARAAAARRDRGARQGRRGQARRRACAAGRRGPDAAARAQPRDRTSCVLWCMGEAHADVLLDRLRNRYGVARRLGAAAGAAARDVRAAVARGTAGT